ncbi:MAG: catalase [Anaerolineaceae bacterium]|nr:catalase [Anaerolineaceae bacterium]
MFYTDAKVQFDVRVEKPNALFAKRLQQAIGGTEGEIRVCMQYMFQAWAMTKKSNKYRSLLLYTAAEELSHIEMLATAVAKNLSNAPVDLQEDAAYRNPMVKSILDGLKPRQAFDDCLHAMPMNSQGAAWSSECIVVSGDLIGDMYANLMAEVTGIALAKRLYQQTNDRGMQHMLKHIIERDKLHQKQWLTVLAELGELTV